MNEAPMRLTFPRATGPLFVAFLLSTSLSTSAPATPGECKRHIELHGGRHWAKELGRTEMWVLANHRIKVWKGPGPQKGAAVGEMRVGSRAVILEERTNDYKVKSPLDSSIGWISKVQV